MTVYRGMDRATLDAAYNNSEAVADSASRVAEWERRSALVRRASYATLDLAYGPAPKNRIDYFSSGEDAAPLFVFLHGGYWQRNSKETFSFVAEGVRAHAIDVAVVGYTLAPEAKLSQIVEEIDAAIDFLAASASTLPFDAGRMHVGGWSAGGQLAAAAAHNPHVRGVLSISGIFDLEPMAKCYINDALNLDETEIRTLSPIHNIPTTDVRYQLYVGGDELPELQRQSVEFAAALKALGLAVDFTTVAGMNHFTVVDELAHPDGVLAKGLARMMGTTSRVATGTLIRQVAGPEVILERLCLQRTSCRLGEKVAGVEEAPAGVNIVSHPADERRKITTGNGVRD